MFHGTAPDTKPCLQFSQPNSCHKSPCFRRLDIELTFAGAASHVAHLAFRSLSLSSSPQLATTVFCTIGRRAFLSTNCFSEQSLCQTVHFFFRPGSCSTSARDPVRATYQTALVRNHADTNSVALNYTTDWRATHITIIYSEQASKPCSIFLKTASYTTLILHHFSQPVSDCRDVIDKSLWRHPYLAPRCPSAVVST